MSTQRPRPRRALITALVSIASVALVATVYAAPLNVTATPDLSALARELNNPAVPWSRCAKQGGTCRFTGTMMVRYGLPDHYAYKVATSSIACTNKQFGNPIPGRTKYCSFRTWPPATTSAPTTVPAISVPATTPPVTTPPVTVPPATVPPTTVPPTTVPVTTPVTTVPAPTAPQGGNIASNFNVGQYLNTGLSIPASTASEPSGNFRMICNFSHLAYDDPIVYPGQPGASHLHMFFGNTGANANSTLQSLRTTGDGTCQGGPINRSTYWAPAVLNNTGKVVVPDFATVYYKGNGTAQTIAQIQPLPAGLKMIAGYNMAAPGGATHYDWYCEVTQNKQQTIPTCPTGERVGAVIRFPSCWDGVHLDSADHRSHMSYTVGHDFSGVCPATHPVHLPDYTIGFWFPNDGASGTWSLDSDHMPGMTHANGSTFHADWFGAWDPAVQATLNRECIVKMRDCKNGELGDGTQLSTHYAFPDRLHAGPPTISRPGVA